MRRDEKDEKDEKSEKSEKKKKNRKKEKKEKNKMKRMIMYEGTWFTSISLLLAILSTSSSPLHRFPILQIQRYQNKNSQKQIEEYSITIASDMNS
tara:strand:+ start:291 stop:575 length:285 start_codon:yes stop_codon:yes gene_type:complete